MYLIPKEKEVKQMKHKSILTVIQTRPIVSHFATLHVFYSNTLHTMQNYNISLL